MTDKLREDLLSYNHRVDYCGSGWTRAIVPCSIRGISINYCCFLHDRFYALHQYKGKKITRKQADVLFRKEIYKTLRKGGMWFPGAVFYSRVYYRACRKFGFLCWN
ncbi:MAG: hypothetical protein ACTSXD_06050 [Candidatus Heimdallarchaeaceae archaeon]